MTENPTLYALLIGIDCYMPNCLPDGSRYRNLGGSVRDINHVEAFLKDHQGVNQTQILKLTATSSPDDDTKPIESPNQLPTYQNIVNSFRKLGVIAPAGSQVYIHYSGHGGRAKTVYPAVKGDTGIDEGLVPTDIGAGQYVRDLELALLLKELADKNLIVTLVLDCCNSGGATRGDAEIRGIDTIDDRPLPADFTPIAPIEVLTEHWRSLTQQSTRGLKAGGLPESQDYLLIAACRENESAYEYAFNRVTRERNGALTYWLLDTLQQQQPGRTYKDLYDRINAQIHSQFPQQTPILLGQGDRLIFGRERGAIAFTIPVLKVEQTEIGVQALLGVGQSNGITKGAEFAIYPRGTTDFTKKADRVAIAKLIQRGSTESLCTLEAIDGKLIKVEPGDQAVQISIALSLIRKVSLFVQQVATPEELIHSIPPNKLRPEVFVQQQAALDAIKAAIPGNGWVELDETIAAGDNGEFVNFIVAINNNGEYEICPGGSAVPFKNINPPLRIDDRTAPEKLVRRLVHLAKYQAAAEIDNVDTDSPLSGKLAVEWLGTSDLYDPGDPIPKASQLKPSDPTKPTVKLGEYIFLSIRNTSSQTLNVAVLNLESDWTIEQIYPQYEQFITLEPDKEKKVPLKASLEGSEAQIENTVKVFATVGVANFRWLELPSLDQAIVPKAIARSGGLLDTLFAAIDAEQPTTRKLTVAASPSREWTTKQVSLTITK